MSDGMSDHMDGSKINAYYRDDQHEKLGTCEVGSHHIYGPHEETKECRKTWRAQPAQGEPPCWHKETNEEGICKACGAKAAVRLPISPIPARNYSADLSRIPNSTQAEKAGPAEGMSAEQCGLCDVEKFYEESAFDFTDSATQRSIGDIMRFAEAYAALKVREAYDHGFEQGHFASQVQFAQQIGELREERDVLKRKLEGK